MNAFFFFSCDKCYKWCHEPKGFHELEHGVRCQCGELMYRTHGTPEDYAMPKADKIDGQLVKGE